MIEYRTGQPEMKTEAIQAIYHQMLEAVVGMDEERALELYADLKKNGHDFSIKTSESVRWTNVNGTKHAIVRQESQLFLSNIPICKWSGEYAGSYGCMATGWWVDRIDTGEDDLDPCVSELLEICEIFPEDPMVPEPEIDSSVDGRDDH